MYGYEVIIPSNFSILLNTYSQEDIFRIVFKEYPDLDNLYCSPFRVDHHPNCYFEWYKGKLLFRDFGDTRRDCIQAIKDFFNLDTFQDVFEYVAMYFDNHPIPCEERPIKVFERERRDCSITFRLREYEPRDDLYWKQYVITKEQLTEDQVSIIYWYRFYSEKAHKWIVLRPFDIAYAISGFESRCKIYRPMSYNKKSKWLTNTNPSDIGNLQNIDHVGSTLIITKSYKDHRVIRNQGYKNVVWFQSEKMIPSNEKLIDLMIRFKKIFIFYDNDEAGITGANALMNRFLLQPFNTSIEIITSPYSHMKDPAEIVSVRGEQELKQLLQNKINPDGEITTDHS